MLRRGDLVGGQIESHERGAVFLGSIADIKMEGDRIVITNQWVLRITEPKEGEDSQSPVQRWPILTFTVDPQACQPSDHGDGRVYFALPGVGYTMIYPRGRTATSQDGWSACKEADTATTQEA